ncbi:P-loop containing nucleoside triphosphate hydrolase protein [Coprinopsis sp. MPI-PUGE-AT-0042]|nr:P-loop containing nucleoside triphosphate hydrolase protein [Coprinopsis sp. MPI-PUGE-AT-0042]
MGKFDLNRIRRQDDAVMEGGRETDLVILVMGPTGAGKSTFLRNILEKWEYCGALPDVSDGFESCTRKLAAYIAPVPPEFANTGGQRLVLVDTPGFDDTSVSDSEILRRISVWLASSYNLHMKVTGVVYMFPIFPNRITRNDKANLKVFQRLCGKGALAKVRMVTTKWSLCPDPMIVDRREEQLKSNFWREMVEGGSELSRLDDKPASAIHILEEIIANSRYVEVALALQKEIVEMHRSLPRTDAGREIKLKLDQLLEEHKAATGDLHTRWQKLQQIVDQLVDMNVSISQRLRVIFGLPSIAPAKVVL